MVTKANKISREACKIQWNTWDASRAERLHRANGFRVSLVSTLSSRPGLAGSVV